ncbi:AraC family transcriptional regulator [Paenibacillaceae bacterium]|nr:AraC family transcriptional regulator [Paenibacillaceae bacterium]
MTLAKESRKGILSAKRASEKFVLTRWEPIQAHQHFVQHYWIITWDLQDGEQHCQTVLSHPNVNLVFDRQATGIFGVSSRTSSHLLAGQGNVFGVKFKVGGFYPFWKKPVSGLSDRMIRLGEVFPDIAGQESQLEDDILTAPDHRAMVAIFERFLSTRLPLQDRNVDRVGCIVKAIASKPDITRVDDISEHTGLNKRTIQRLFNSYVGVSPKWVIGRYRLHEAAEQMEREGGVDWLQLALNLGYYDQAHFIKDFKKFVGKAPEEYRREMEQG